MFKDSLVESCGRLDAGPRRWIAAGSFGLQSLIGLSLVAVPLLRPEALSFRVLAPAVTVPSVRKPPIKVAPREAAAPFSSTRWSPPVEQVTAHAAILPRMHPVDTQDAPPGAIQLTSMGSSGSAAGDLLDVVGAGRGHAVTAAAGGKPGRTPTISSGISAGMLLGPICPVYPRIAVAAHVEGAVVVEATISKTGTIESARVVSGSAMLAGAALEAVRAARYRPYLLNGEATEVRTTVTVNFRLGSG